MKCEIIRDLIPLYSERLCSEESEKEIQEHIKSCNSCRILYEKIPVNSDSFPDSNIPDQSDAFKKVNNKIRSGRVKLILLIIFLLLVAGVLVFLSVGQISQHENSISFSTIFQSVEMRKTAQYLAEGDAKDFLGNLSSYSYSSMEPDDIREWSIEEFNNAYQQIAAFKPKLKKIHSFNTTWYNDHYIYSDSTESELPVAEYKTILTEITLSLENNSEIIFHFIKDTTGKYMLVDSYSKTDNDDSSNYFEGFTSSLVFISAPKLKFERTIIPRILVKPNVINSKAASVSKITSRRFQNEDQAKVKQNILDFYQQGYIIDDVFFSECFFDSERKQFYTNVSMTACDDKGTAVLTARMYYDKNGLFPPEDEFLKVYCDNCSSDLVKCLSAFWG
ncbi:MAG: zf-HC2 domain-containing protein [Ruminococcus sp.]